MGARGPAPTPTQLRLLHGETRPSRIHQNEPKPRAVLPVAPDWLTDRARSVWDRTVAELDHMGMATMADQDSLVVYCQSVAHYEEACRLVNTAGLLIRGRDGGVVKNPAMQFVRDQAVLIRAYAREFGLTPAARVGLETGEQPEQHLGPQRLLS
jgi:P27 family predicted phage terminase small subunit